MSDIEIKGILGKKLGMTQIFDEENRVVPVTVLSLIHISEPTRPAA